MLQEAFSNVSLEEGRRWGLGISLGGWMDGWMDGWEALASPGPFSHRRGLWTKKGPKGIMKDPALIPWSRWSREELREGEKQPSPHRVVQVRATQSALMKEG